MTTFREWLKNPHQFEDAEYAAKKLTAAGMDPKANVPEILEAMEIMDIRPWDGTSKEIFAARIKQTLRGNVSKGDFSFADRPMRIKHGGDVTFEGSDPIGPFGQPPLFGWLSPNGRLTTCGKYKHFEAIINTPELFDILSETTKKMIRGADSARKQCGERDAAGLAPEWHEYEMLLDDGKRLALDDIYINGFLRVASKDEDLHFEGTSEAIRNLHNKATQMSEERWGRAHFWPIGHLS